MHTLVHMHVCVCGKLSNEWSIKRYRSMCLSCTLSSLKVWYRAIVLPQACPACHVL